MTYPAAFLDKHRYINVDDDHWYESVVSDFKEDMKERGLCVSNVYFSGFCSQGDGACCEGFVCDVAAVLRSHSLSEKYPPIAQASMGTGFMSWKQQGRYYHQHSMVFDCDYEDAFEDALGHVFDVDMLEDTGVTQFHDAYFSEVCTLREHIRDLIRDYCTDLYNKLEKEYDYHTSDEAVIETLEANDIQPDDEEQND